MIINNDLPYEVLNDGDALQIIHACCAKTLICFVDPNSNAETLAWVRSDNIYQNTSQPQKAIRGGHLKLVSSNGRAIIDNIQEADNKEVKRWTLNRFLRSLFWWARLLLQVLLVVLAILFTL
jgi:hypothetical protein